jgi:DnaJ-class molecular chaperone
MKFERIDEARKLLGLDEEATLEEVEKAFKKLSLKYHPDKKSTKDKEESGEKFKKINNAKELIRQYIANYRYSFKKKDVKKQSVDMHTYKHLKRFYDDWWGKLDF